MSMWVGLVTCELYVPGARSLKEKRRAVKSFVDRAHKRHRVSVAETGHHDVHQRAEIGLAVVAGSQAAVLRLLDSLRALTDELYEAEVTRWDERVVSEGEWDEAPWSHDAGAE
jgi:uncharacterized protein YlxP (DUF503 family)